MCLIALALHAHPLYPLVVAANRDEALARPSAPADFWPDADGLLAGRDEESGGTWMGVTRSGRFAALTNVRDGRPPDPLAPSRGGLVVRFLAGGDEPLAHARAVAAERVRRNGFNLLAGAGGRLAWVSNAGGGPAEVTPGVHAVSNAALDSPWPKSLRTAAGLRRVLEDGGAIDPEELFAILSDRRIAADDELPETGVPLEVERLLSAPFIVAPGYGTRSSTLLLAARDGRAELLERRFDTSFRESGTSRFELDFPGWNGRVETRFPSS
ncbi:MAG: NRDE family protein [Thermoanaerobaculia bacterium]|nr:NRDE family protein [Thermoanaerobaculia bacterium]